MSARSTTYRWYLYRTVGGRTIRAAKVTGATDCQVWNWNNQQWEYTPIAEQVEFSDTSWDQVTKAEVDQFISGTTGITAMPHWHSPEGAALEQIRKLVDWAEIPEVPDGEEMHKMLRQAVEMIGQLRVKLDTGNLTRAQDEGYVQGI